LGISEAILSINLMEAGSMKCSEKSHQDTIQEYTMQKYRKAHVTLKTVCQFITKENFSVVRDGLLNGILAEFPQIETKYLAGFLSQELAINVLKWFYYCKDSKRLHRSRKEIKMTIRVAISQELPVFLGKEIEKEICDWVGNLLSPYLIKEIDEAVYERYVSKHNSKTVPKQAVTPKQVRKTEAA